MTTYVNASCQCNLNAFRVAFNTASLPLSHDVCHCSACQHSSGQMAVCQIPVKGAPLERPNEHGHSHVHQGRSDNSQVTVSHHGNVIHAPITTASGSGTPSSTAGQEEETPFHLNGLKAYKTSSNVTRYFCRSCSAQILLILHKEEGNVWLVGSGALERTSGVVNATMHLFVGDTVDGGLADRLRVIDGVKLPRYKEWQTGEEVPFPWRAEGYAPLTGDTKDDKQVKEVVLGGFCHCKTISFKITRPSEASLVPNAAYPDLLYPYDMSLLSKLNNGKDEKWWLRPSGSSNYTKYLAGHCMCNFCRLAAGFEIQSWGFIPLANIMRSDMSTPFCLEIEEKRPVGLQQYISNPGEYIEFCGTCGATVFSWQAGMPDLVHVSLGLLDEGKEGARAEGWFEWHRERVSFQEKALNTSIANGLAEGLKSTL